MGKRGPKRIPTEILAKRGSPLAKARLKAERKVKAEFIATGIWNVDATVDINDLDAITIELSSDVMATDLTVTFTGSDALSKKAIQKAFGIPPIPA